MFNPFRLFRFIPPLCGQCGHVMADASPTSEPHTYYVCRRAMSEQHSCKNSKTRQWPKGPVHMAVDKHITWLAGVRLLERH